MREPGFGPGGRRGGARSRRGGPARVGPPQGRVPRDQTDVLAELVAQLEHEAHVAHDGNEAIRLTHELRPDLVLLDIGLPGMGGYETAAGLRRDPANAGALLVPLTGYSQPSDRDRSTVAGFDLHVVKPINSDMLAGLLDGRRPG